MKYINILSICSLLIVFTYCSSKSESEVGHNTGNLSVGDIARDFKLEKVIKFSELQEYMVTRTDTKVKVINFWATWCQPCVKELPFIDSLRYAYDPHKIEVLLVNLDFPDERTKVNAFLQRKKIGAPVWLLDESDPNLFIDQVDPSWSGAIPATLLIQNATAQRVLLEGELTKAELEEHINKLLKD
ncbi:TlpA disulfide reductase family protein [uncultured Pontibacter sp.]|uniref:TlpA family protein disulfide reductase n=1 Tax=uncultured Pontibacter sp. TaxID=453356 RepID=UPI00261037AF|nr:TlpA disulfide reductase family protein [uncultured Pontibacter sp.]